MAWNRPKENGEAVSRPLPKRKGFRFPIRGAIAGAIFSLGAAVAAWWLWPTGETRQDAASTKKSALIREHAHSTNRVVQASVATNDAPKRPQRVGEIRNGYRLLCDGRLQKVSPHPIIIELDESAYGPGPRFEDPGNQMLADFVQIEPGEAFVGDPEVDFQGFDRRFAASMLAPVRIEPEDSEYHRQVKQAVIDLKKELAQRLKDGEDITRLMIDAKNQLRELGTYRQELEQELHHQMRGRKLTPEERHDLIEAANRMLEERGCKKFELPTALDGMIRVKEARENKQ